MLKKLKRFVIGSAHGLGVTSLVLNSGWRRQKLLILCYHGVSLDDEHQWAPDLYLSPGDLRERFRILTELGCSVIPLEVGLRLLSEDRLPPKAVTLTFDDGTFDFYSLTAPALRDSGFPATLYYTTYYSNYNRPVFDPMCSYLLWKARRKRFTLEGFLDDEIDLEREHFELAAVRIQERALELGLSAVEKDFLLFDLADRLGVDYDAICRKRILHLMTPAEAREVASDNLKLELHTHRHRVSRSRRLFQREILQNREHIAAVTPTPARHFCYPCGVYEGDFPEWLSRLGVQSATTCEPGLATRSSQIYRLPRLVDSSLLTTAEFRAWIAGYPALFPHRKPVIPTNQFLEETRTGEGDDSTIDDRRHDAAEYAGAPDSNRPR
ncbi:MAG: polysaccharide deacetylase family protein [Bryobacteraceae bacterium]